jgi:hypothetical protein
VIASLSGAVVGWLVLIQIWVLVLWYRSGKNSFARRLNQLLAVLLAETEAADKRATSAEGEGTSARLVGSSRLGRVKSSARRWRTQLRAIYVQGYEAAAETISPSGHVAHGRDLVQDTLGALKAARQDGGNRVPPREDPVVVFAYGLGAWPPGADLTSLERLLAEIGVSQPALRSRFDSLCRSCAPGAPAQRAREFRELAGASFVLGAAARILEAADTSNGAVPPPGFLAKLKTHLR